MSPKELLYIEDALGHTQFLMTQCRTAASQLNILITTKGVVDLYMHGTVESATPNVHGTFNTALNSALCMQSDVYKEMAERGWYPAEQATQQKLDAVKQKYAGIA